MVRITFPLPSSTWRSLKAFFRGTLLDIVWKLFIIGLLIGLGYILSSLGPIGAVIGGTLLSTLFASDVRRAVKDIFNRDFAEVSL